MDISNKEYMLVNLPYIKKNIDHFTEHADLAFKRFEFSYGKKSPTAFYKYYNCSVSGLGCYNYIYD